MNFKKILFALTAAATLFSFTACGGEGGDGPVGPGSSSSKPIEPPKQSTLSPVIFSGINIQPMSGERGMRGSLSGIIKLDPDFMDTSEPYTADVDVKIDSVSFAVGKMNGTTAYEEPVTINLDGVMFPTEQVFFSQKFIEYADLSGCGTFKFFIYVYSSSKEKDVKTSYYTSVFDSLTFTRPETECQAPSSAVEPTSSAAACTPVTAHQDTLSNSLGTSKSAINFETGLADNPHITVKFADNAATIIPSAGVTVHEDVKQISGLLPTTPQICAEDFAKANPQFNEELSSGLWLDVVTADGKMYPVMIRKVLTESATKGTVSIVYYK